jgi:hypothetical protein
MSAWKANTMNQAISKQRNQSKNIGVLERRVSSITAFWIVAFAAILFLYVPLFSIEYSFRQAQISHGSSVMTALPVWGSDSMEYATLANNLLHHQVFSLDLKTPETFRSVGYPALLAGYLSRGLPFAAFPFVQMLLAVLTSFAIFLIGKNFWKTSVGFCAGVLYLFDPVTILNSLTLVTDIFYVFLVIWAFYFFFVYASGSWQMQAENAYETGFRAACFSWALGGLLLGLSTLVRPISMFLLFVFICLYFIKTKIERAKLLGRTKLFDRAKLASIFVPVLLCLVCYSAVVTPWIFRNKKVSGVYGVSTVKSYNIYHYYIPEFLAFKKGISADDARKEVAKGLGVFDERSLTNATKMQDRAFEFIKQKPISYVSFHLFKTIPFFISSGVETMFTAANDALGYEAFSTVQENMTGLLLHGKLSELLTVVRSHHAIAAEQIILCGLWLLALLSLSIGYKRKDFFKVFLLWIVILYFTVLTGPVAYSRYRLPASPFLFLLASYAIVIRSYAPPHNHPKTR